MTENAFRSLCALGMEALIRMENAQPDGNEILKGFQSQALTLSDLSGNILSVEGPRLRV